MDSVAQSESQQVLDPGRECISVPGKGRKKPLSQLEGSQCQGSALLREDRLSSLQAYS